MKDYVLLKQDEEDVLPRETISNVFNLVPWLPAISTVLMSLALFAFAGMPSTMLIYLSFLAIYSVAGITSLLGKVTFNQQKLPFTPAMSLAFALIIFPLLAPSLLPPVPSTSALESTSPPVSTTPSPPNSGVLFVAANLYNSEAILPQFTSSLMELAKTLGQDNVFISIYESNSDDNTKALLSQFDKTLTNHSIPHRIEMASTANHIGVKGAWRRIEFLADLRNKVYNALDVAPGIEYKPRVNRVLWLNDVLFKLEDVLTLLNTNGGHYDLACGFDYVPIGFYDTWVVRDWNLKRLKPYWPHFADPEDVEHLRNDQPIRVRSCWNGIAVYNADLVLDGRPSPITNASTLSKDVSWPLRFRKSGQCLTSECLSINYDLHLLLANDRIPEIYINPTVRVAYEKATYYIYTQVMRWRIVTPWHFVWQDWIAHRMFWFVTEMGRKEASCAKELDKGFHAFHSLPHQRNI